MFLTSNVEPYTAAFPSFFPYPEIPLRAGPLLPLLPSLSHSPLDQYHMPCVLTTSCRLTDSSPSGGRNRVKGGHQIHSSISIPFSLALLFMAKDHFKELAPGYQTFYAAAIFYGQ